MTDAVRLSGVLTLKHVCTILHVMETFGQTIRRLRKEAGLTRPDVHERLDISIRYQAYIEADDLKGRNPSLKVILGYADLLGPDVLEAAIREKFASPDSPTRVWSKPLIAA